MADAKTTLKEWCDENRLSEATLSEDGGNLFLGGQSLDGKENLILHTSDGKEIVYSVASIYLQILDPNQSLVKYRGACKKYQVADHVKALDKPTVVGYFLSASSAPASETASAAALPDKPLTDSASDGKTPDQQHRKDKESASTSSSKQKRSSSSSSKHRNRDKKRPTASSSSHKDKDKHGDKRKKHKAMVTNEQLFSDLNVVVDKRAGAVSSSATGDKTGREDSSEKVQEQPKNEEYEAIRKALSPEGFQVTPEMLEANKDVTDRLMAHEIPVGDSASVLRASSAGANLTRVLNIFLESVNPKLAQKKGMSTTPIKKAARPYLIGKKPIILLPKGMTAPITMLNGYEFFANARFIPRDVMMKNKALQANSKTTCFTRKMPGVGLVEFELLDNPRKLNSKEEWERVVAVIVLGHKWQFKDWPGRTYSDPVQLFSKTFGFYIGIEGDRLPNDLLGWACKQGKLHRDKRGLDSVTSASFWNALDDWMKIHKPELLPHSE